jgi:hypothetical protein
MNIIINILKINSGISKKYPKWNGTHSKNSNGRKLFSIQTEI